jgi:hypothetical protein
MDTLHWPGALASALQVIADEQLVIELLRSLRRVQRCSRHEGDCDPGYR